MAETSVNHTSTVYTLNQLREIIVPLVHHYGMKWARVFGSYARGEATEESDLDIVVDLGDAQIMSLFGLMNDIYKATGKQPDVYDISELKPGPFRDAAISEGVLL